MMENEPKSGERAFSTEGMASIKVLSGNKLSVLIGAGAAGLSSRR